MNVQGTPSAPASLPDDATRPAPDAPAAGEPPRKQARVGSPRPGAPALVRDHARPASPRQAGAQADMPGQPAPVAAAAAGRPTGSAPRLPAAGDLRLAGYLLAREAVGRPVDAPTRELLRRANDTRKETLALMPYGRSNVHADLAQTDHAGFHRMLAYRHAVGSVSSLGEAPQVSQARDAALSAYVGSGNCGEFANVAAHVHAGRLQAGERLEMQKSGSVDHSWVVVHGAPHDGRTSPPRALIDAWGEGFAMEPGDSRFVASAPASPRTLHTIGSAEADAVHRDFERLKAEPGAKTARRLDLLIASNQRAGRRPVDALYDPVPVVSRRLGRSAHEAVQARAGDPVLRERAIALAREIAPVDPAAEGRVADAVLAFAQDLSAHESRPLAGPPLGGQDGDEVA